MLEYDTQGSCAHLPSSQSLLVQPQASSWMGFHMLQKRYEPRMLNNSNRMCEQFLLTKLASLHDSTSYIKSSQFSSMSQNHTSKQTLKITDAYDQAQHVSLGDPSQGCQWLDRNTPTSSLARRELRHTSSTCRKPARSHHRRGYRIRKRTLEK